MRLFLLLIYFVFLGLMTLTYYQPAESGGTAMAADDSGTAPWIDSYR